MSTTTNATTMPMMMRRLLGGGGLRVARGRMVRTLSMRLVCQIRRSFISHDGAICPGHARLPLVRVAAGSIRAPWSRGGEDKDRPFFMLPARGTRRRGLAVRGLVGAQ